MTDTQLNQLAQELLASRISNLDSSSVTAATAPSLVGCCGATGSLLLQFQTSPWMSNPMGILHGGMAALFLDSAMGITCLCQCRHLTPTISLTLNYQRPVPLGSTVHIRTHISHCGSLTAHTTAELFLPEQPEKVLVSASGVYCTKPKT